MYNVSAGLSTPSTINLPVAAVIVNVISSSRASATISREPLELPVVTASAVPNVFKSDTTSAVPKVFKSATTSAVPSIDISSTAAAVPSLPISVALPATVVTSVAFGTSL